VGGNGLNVSLTCLCFFYTCVKVLGVVRGDEGVWEGEWWSDLQEVKFMWL
jgi:hypothetical protein